jgi:tRNA splicing endonuclease
MKMTKKMMAVMAILTLGTSMAQAQAMGGVGNGGGTHWCPDKAPEMYDIYEGKRRYKLEIVDDGSRTEDVIEKAILRVKSTNVTLANEISKKIDFLNNGGLSFESGLALNRVPDANVLMVDKGCEYRQIANWDNASGRVFVNNDYYDRMDDFNKAALILHEAIYAVSRERLQTDNSDSSRRLVADLLAARFDRSSLNHLTKTDDIRVMITKEGVSTVYESNESVLDSSALMISQHAILRVHTHDLNLGSINNFGKLIIRVPRLIEASRELLEIKQRLNNHENRTARISRKERRGLERKQYALDEEIRRTHMRINTSVLVNGIGEIDLQEQKVRLNGSMLFGQTTPIDVEFEFQLTDGTGTKSFEYHKTIKLAGSNFSKPGSSNYTFDFMFSQNP